MKLHDALAAALVAEQCDTVFGVMGDGNLPIYAAIGARKEITVHASRHEGGAVGMADGYFRACGRIAVATVTWGPGLTQCVTQLTVASRNHTPMLLITGTPVSPNPDRHQALDHQLVADLAEVPRVTVTELAKAAEQISQAFQAARTRPGPVLLEIPIALQGMDVAHWAYRSSLAGFAQPAPLAPDESALARLADRIAASERPVFIAGAGAARAGAREAIARLADQVGAVLANTMLAKDYFIGLPWDAGMAGGFASAPGAAVLAQADLVVGFGAILDHFTTRGGELFAHADFARIDIAPAPEQPGLRPGPYLRADARLAAEALGNHLARRGVSKAGLRTPANRALLDAPPAPRTSPQDGIDPARLMHELSRHLPANARVSCGVGHYWGTVLMHLAVPPTAQFETILQFGSIGQAFTSAIGAALSGSGRPQIVIEGDGSLLMQLAEIETAARLRAPLVVLLVNDSGYGAEMHKLKAKGFDPTLTQLVSWSSPDFAALARQFGADGAIIREVDELPGALARGLACGTLFVIDARVSPSEPSDSYRAMHLGQANRAPRLVPVRCST